MSRAQPGQVAPNEFELAVLRAIAEEHAELLLDVSALHVLSREFTGVGAFTNFLRDDCALDASEQRLGFSGQIQMPGVPNGLGALLFCVEHRPKMLEVYTFGTEHWGGDFSGFVLHQAA